MRTIDKDTYLKALALATLSNDYYSRCREMQLKADELLGLEDGSHVTDAIYSGDRMTVAHFDEALKNVGVTVEPDA